MRPSFLPCGSMIHIPPCAATIHVAGYVHFHAIGHAGFRAAQLGKDPVAPLRDDAVWEQIEGPDVPAPGVVDVEHAFIRRERKPVGKDKIVDQQAERAQMSLSCATSNRPPKLAPISPAI